MMKSLSEALFFHDFCFEHTPLHIPKSVQGIKCAHCFYILKVLKTLTTLETLCDLKLKVCLFIHLD